MTTSTQIPVEPQAQAVHEDDIGARPVVKRRWWQPVTILAAIGVATFVSFYSGWIPRWHQSRVLAHEAQQHRETLPLVLVDHPQPSSAETELLLPGDIEAIEETTIYPRTSGYLKKWFVDIGDLVTQGQLLAEIDTPEIDQQFRQQEANVEQLTARRKVAETRVHLARINLKRLESLPAGVRTQQELEEQQAEVDVAAHNVKVAEADIRSGLAELQRIKELQAFSKVYAPFAGTITARSIDLGQLVTSGNDQAQSLFRISRTETVCVIIDVPQIYAPSIRAGQSAELVVREMPARKFPGVITRTAGAIDLRTRTLRTEIEVDNAEGHLLIGSYVQAKLTGSRENPPLIIPASSLIFNGEGIKVAVVTDDERVQLRPIEVDGDFGMTLGISTGISQQDRIVVNPGDRLVDRQKIQVVSRDNAAP